MYSGYLYTYPFGGWPYGEQSIRIRFYRCFDCCSPDCGRSVLVHMKSSPENTSF